MSQKGDILTSAAAAKSRQSCPTLCDPIDDSPTGSPVPGILQARTLEWVAIAFSTPALQAGSLLSEPQWTRAIRSIYFVLQKVAL